jgi:hypothetical protein
MIPEYREFLEKIYEMTNGHEKSSVGDVDAGKQLGSRATGD